VDTASERVSTPDAGDPAWTARQKEVLDLIARSKTNQEVADTLGISLDGAKWHMREILSKLGVDTREEAAEYWRRRNGWLEKSKRAVQRLGIANLSVRLGLAGVAAALAGVAAILVLLQGGDEDSPQPPADALDTASPSPSPSPSPPVVVVNGRSMFDLGQFFEVDGETEPVATWEARETLLVVTLKGDGRLRLANESVHWKIYGSGGGIVSMYAYAGSTRFTMNVISVGASARFILPSESPASVVFERNSDGPPRFVVAAHHGEGPYGNSPERKYHGSTDQSGHLFLSTDLVADSAVIDAVTGERIDTSGAQSVGLLPGQHVTRCDQVRCLVFWQRDGIVPLKAPAAGTLHCLGAGRLELTTGDLVVEFQEIPRIAGQDTPTSCPPGELRPVAAGDEIGPGGIYDISVRSDAADELSVGITRAGEVLVGAFRGTVGCPCSDGSALHHGLTR
jgi:DNA-binding CsgD family transcriptional regulator